MTNDNSANNPVPNFYRASAADFKKIPGSPIAYWVSENVKNIFSIHQQIYVSSISDGQNITANNDKYLRFHWEVNKSKVGHEIGKWVFYSKGGSFRKWFGNLEYLVDWSDEARQHYRKHPSARIIPEYLWFKEGITWTLITSSKQSFRFLPEYATFDKGGSSIFCKNQNDLKVTLLFLKNRGSLLQVILIQIPPCLISLYFFPLISFLKRKSLYYLYSPSKFFSHTKVTT